jgi:hypothetical protein
MNKIFSCEIAEIHKRYSREDEPSVRFEVFTAVTMKNSVFWDIKPSSYLLGTLLRLCFREQPVHSLQGFHGILPSAGMSRSVTLGIADVSEEYTTSIRVTRVGE